MGTSLTGKNISTTYLGLLKTTDNAVIGSTAKRLTDGSGTDSPLYLSTSKLGIGVTPTEALTISSGNIQLSNDNKIQFGTSDVYISGTTSTDNIQLGIQGATKLTLHQTTGLTLAQYGSGSITGTVTQRLGVTSAGQVVEIPIGGGAVDGSGTAGKITKWTDSDTIGDSIMSESGSTISIVDTLKINATTGDSLLQFNITGDTYSMGIDNSDADKFKLAYGVFGSTDLLTIDVDGNSIFSGSLTINKESSSALTISNPSATNDYLLIGHDGSLNSLYTSRAENSYGTHTFRQWDGSTTRSILTLDASQNATFAGDITILEDLYSTNQNLKFHAGGTHVMNIDVNGKVYPTTNDAFDLGHSASLAWRNLYLSDSIIAGGGATFAGNVTLDNILLTPATLPAINTPSISLRSTNNEIYFQAGSANVFNFMKADYTTMLNLDGTNSATFSANVTIDNSSPDLYFVPDASYYSFRLSAQEAVANTFEITPSTAAGGSTYSNPALSISHTGNSTFAGNVKLLNPTATNSKSFSITNASGTTGWTFGNGVLSNTHQFVIYDNTAGSSRMLIDSSGNLLVSKTSANNATVGNQFMTDGSANTTVNGDTVARLNRLTSDGEIIRFQKDTATVGTIGTQNWGIGTGSPSAKLEVSADVAKGVLINRTFTTSSQTLANVRAYYALAITPLRGGTGGLYFTNYDADLPIIQSVNTSDVAQSLLLNPLGGNVGIGTTSPKHYSGTTGTVLSVNSSTHRGVLELSGASNSDEAIIGAITFANTENTSLNGALSQIFTYTKTTDSNAGDDSGGHLAFLTKPEAGTITERMRITSDGGFWVGTSTRLGTSNTILNAATAGDWALNVRHSTGTASSNFGILIDYAGSAPNGTGNYFIQAQDSSSTRFLVSSNGDVTNSNNSYGAISDEKLKENITDATPKLDDLMNVKIRNYNLIGEDKKQIGVIAQELEKVFPTLIDEAIDFEEQEVTDKDGNVKIEKVDLGTTTKSVKYSVFVPMLIKSIQELEARIKELENK